MLSDKMETLLNNYYLVVTYLQCL